MLFRIEDVPDGEMLPKETEMVDAGEVARVQKRQDLGKNVVRVHEMSVDEYGGVKIRSRKLKREL
jgi:hypothetical protein